MDPTEIESSGARVFFKLFIPLAHFFFSFFFSCYLISFSCFQNDALHLGEEVFEEHKDAGEEGFKTASGQKNSHDDDSVVSPAVDKDAIIVDDEEGEAVDLPSKELASIPTFICVLINVEATHLKPVEEK